MASISCGLWAPFKEIFNTVESAVQHRRSDVYAELDEILTKYKTIFISLLKNPIKNAAHREQIQKSNKVELKVDGYTGGLKLQDSTIQELLLLSDALELNEFSCLELMLTAEKQLPNFPGFTPSLIASILYHDGRRCLLSSLKMILMARPGIAWTLELDDRIVELIEKFVDQLLEDGLVSKVLQLLEDISLPKELKKLEDGRCLLDGKHKKIITELIEEEQILLADCLFSLACQFPLDKSSCIKLLDYLKLVAPNTSDGSLDFVTIRVLLSLLASFNCNVIDLAVENIEDDQYHRLPYFKEKTFFADMHKVIARPDSQVWQTPEIKSLVQLCWSIFLRSCSAHPELVDCYGDILEDDEGILDAAIDDGALQYFRTGVIGSNKFHEEEYFVKVTHAYITSFIVKFPLKMKELRNRSDENARILQAHIVEGIDPPFGLKHDFQDFMNLVSSLYVKDPACLELSSEYWVPPEPLGGMFSPQPLKRYQQAADHKQLMLNKFVRLAGDILLQSLYVPYVNMLAALSNNEQSASYCFQLLSGSLESSGACSVSWDHFFNSLKQYYMSLRNVADPSDHRSHMHRHQEISPEEQAGLESVLQLIKNVADKNESVRVAFCENPTWLPVASLFGLVCCPVPPSMKGLLLDTLAAFSKTPEIAASLWQSLEASQVLQTTSVSAGVTMAKSGIAVELQEIESRNETYPETLAFISLISKLTDIAIPPTLGAGFRVPGFDPYLKFLLNQVFLKFKTRAYQDVSEKWKIASEVVKIFVKLLKEYDPQPNDFIEQNVEIQGVNFGRAGRPSGFQLLMQLLNDTPLLRMVLSVIDDVHLELKTLLTTNDRKSLLEEAARACLQLLECAFEKQTSFIEMAKSCSASLIISPLDELLLFVNPRTGKPDYLCVLGNFMTYTNIQASLMLSVVRLFKYVCDGSKAQKEIVEMLTRNETASRELLVGFSEQLELCEPEENRSIEDPSQTLDDAVKENTTDLIRQNIVALIISTLHQPAPNMAQFLLGFEVRRSLSQTTLQDPGIGGFPKTCLHSILDILDRGLINTTPLTPKLSELLYRLVSMLSAHLHMGPPVRRYLRANTGFFIRHCQALPFIRNKGGITDDLLYIRLLNQQSWLLKAVAIELRVVAASRMRSGLQQLLSLLYSEEAANVITTHTNSHDKSTLLESTLKKRDTLSQTMFSSCFTFGSGNQNLILSLLNSLSFTQRYPPNVTLNYFDYSAVEQMIVFCEEVNEMGVRLCNVKKLFKTMMNEINSSQLAVSASQKEEILKEVRFVLKHAVDRNVVRQSFHAKHNAFDAWRQVVEATFAVCPVDVLTVDKKQMVLVEILQAIIPMMNNEENLPDLTSSIGGTILALMANLWLTFTQLDNGTAPTEISNVLHSISTLFGGIVTAISKTAGAQPRVRANLYGAFLYYIQIGHMYTSIVTDGGVAQGIFGNQSKEQWELNTLRDLDKCGEEVLDAVTKDACQGPCITRIMAMSVLQALLSLDWKHKYLSLMSSRGYLRVLVDQLLEEDLDLVDVLSIQPQSMKPLYLFEAKMAMLSKIASTDFGAQTLLQVGLISRLSECQFLDFHLDKPSMVSNTTTNYTSNNDPFLPNLHERYSKIFTSFAKLLLSFLSSLGIRHQVAVSQIQNLILNHEDAIKNILQDANEVQNVTHLKQLSLTIAIISVLPSIGNKDEAWEIVTDDQRHWRTFMNRVQRNMGGLLHKYSSSSLDQQLMQILGHEHSHNSTIKHSPLNVVAFETRNMLLQIRSRIFTFAKNFITNQGFSGPYSRILFAPVVTSKLGHETSMLTGKSITSKQLPSLSILVEELNHCPEELKLCLENKRILERKLEAVTDLTHEEIKEILSQEEDAERLPQHERQVIVQRILRNLIELRQAEANYLTYIIEHVIYILWRHVDYYFNHCVASDDDFLEDGSFSKSFNSQRGRRLTDESFSSFIGRNSTQNHQSPSGFDRSSTRASNRQSETAVTKEDIRELKAEVAVALNASLWKKILESDQLHGRQLSRLSFSSALVRRLKGLVQLNC